MIATQHHRSRRAVMHTAGVRWRDRAAKATARRLDGLPRRAGLRILLYHAVGTPIPYANDYGMSVSPSAFRAHLDALRARSDIDPCSLSVELRGDMGIAITFDDGFADVLDVAAPALTERGFPFAVFVTTGWTGRKGYLSKNALRELASISGATIGSHSVAHRPLTKLDDRELAEELGRSRSQLEDDLGIVVDTFSYPHGIVDGRVRNAVVTAGYARACTSRFGRNGPSTDRYLLRRCEVVADDDSTEVVRKATGAWDWLGLRRSPAA